METHALPGRVRARQPRRRRGRHVALDGARPRDGRVPALAQPRRGAAAAGPHRLRRRAVAHPAGPEVRGQPGRAAARRWSSTRSTPGSAGAWPRSWAASCATIAERHQVLCVTHLPQIASLADRASTRCASASSTGRTITEVGARSTRRSASRKWRACWAARRSPTPRGATRARWSSRACAPDADLSSMRRKSRFFIETFGCQMNVNDSEKVAGLLLAEGYERAARRATTPTSSSSTPARCARRPRRSSTTRSAGCKRLKRERPEPRDRRRRLRRPARGTRRSSSARPTSTCSSAPTTSPRSRARSRRARAAERRGVDLDRKADSLRRSPTAPSRTRAPCAPTSPRWRAATTSAASASCRARADRRSAAIAEAIVAEVRSLVARGYPEVMLLGQTVNAYRHGGLDFAGLLARVHAIAGPAAAALHDLASRARRRAAWRAPCATCPRVCPYLHLPVQSGSDRILAVDAPRLHARRVPARRSRCCARTCPTWPSRATSSSAIPGRRSGTSRRRSISSRRSASTGSSSSRTRRARARRRVRARRRRARATRSCRRLQVLNDHAAAGPGARATGAASAAARRSWSTPSTERGPRLRPHAATSGSSTSTAPRACWGSMIEVRRHRRRPQLARGPRPPQTLH